MSKYLHKVDWQSLSYSENQILLVDIQLPEPVMFANVTLMYNKEELFKVDSFVKHYSENSQVKFAVCYNIVERLVDNQGNLVLFVTSQNVEL